MPVVSHAQLLHRAAYGFRLQPLVCLFVFRVAVLCAVNGQARQRKRQRADVPHVDVCRDGRVGHEHLPTDIHPEQWLFKLFHGVAHGVNAVPRTPAGYRFVGIGHEFFGRHIAILHEHVTLHGSLSAHGQVAVKAYQGIKRGDIARALNFADKQVASIFRFVPRLKQGGEHRCGTVLSGGVIAMHLLIRPDSEAHEAQEVVVEDGCVAPFHNERHVGVGFLLRQQGGVGHGLDLIFICKGVTPLNAPAVFGARLGQGGIADGGQGGVCFPVFISLQLHA